MKTSASANEIDFLARSRAAAGVQRETLEKMLKMGWQTMRIVQNGQTSAISLSMKGCSGWLLPDGRFERAALGKKSAYVDPRTMTIVR
jgi:hypothetical protein